MTQLNLIVSLPRTRTAWVANYLTYGPSWCAHDALKDCDSIGQVELWLDGIPASRPHLRSIGVSDSGLALFYPLWKDRFPHARIVVLVQPWERAAASFLEAFREHHYPGLGPPDPGATRDHFRRLDACVQRVRAEWPLEQLLVLSAEQLDNPAHTRRLWEFCVPGEPWDEERWRMLDALRVTVIPEKVQFDPAIIHKLYRQLETPEAPDRGCPSRSSSAEPQPALTND